MAYYPAPISAKLSPEIELLLCCAQTSIASERAQRVQDLLEEDLDWRYLVHTASRHGVMPLLYHSLSTLCPDAVPQAVFAQLRVHFLVNADHNQLLTQELLMLLHMLESHGIPAIPYKGPTLAVAVYGSLALRSFGDLDLLVHTQDFARATQLLLAHGFRRRRDFSWESSFVHDQRMVMVDLHRGLTPPQFPFPLNFTRLWQRRQAVCIASRMVPTLAPEDLLIVLCVQVAKDTWQNLSKSHERRNDMLIKICDIAELLGAHTDMDWGRVLTDTRRLGGQRILLFGLRLAHELLGTALPKDVLQWMQGHPSVGVLSAHVCTQFFHTTNESAVTPLNPARFYWAIRERVRERVRSKAFRYLHYGVSLFVPSEQDRALLPLPGCLAGLYYLMRPLRIVRDYGRRLLREWQKCAPGF
jgi:Uncharacterised nucleotidyltransferase